MKTYQSAEDARAAIAGAQGAAKYIWEIDYNGVRCYAIGSCSAATIIGGKNTYAKNAWARLLEQGVTLISGHGLLTMEQSEAKEQQDQLQREIDANSIGVYLSSRGWGDYSPVKPLLDLRRADAELIIDCRKALVEATDVDQCNQSDAEIIKALAEARLLLARRNAPEPVRGKGYCYACQTYCYGDCGQFTPQKPSKIFVRELSEAIRCDYKFLIDPFKIDFL